MLGLKNIGTMYFAFIKRIICFLPKKLLGSYRLEKHKKIALLTVSLIILMVTVTIFSVAILQTNTSQKNDLATYTGYLIGGGTFTYPVRSLEHPYCVTSNVSSLAFADGRAFVANRTLVESRNVTFKATYLVYYNITEPRIAIDIVKIS